MSATKFLSGAIRSLVLSTAIVLGSALAASAAEVPASVHLTPGGGPDDVRAALQEAGFSDVGPVEQKGNVYLTKVKWEGQWVDLSIDSRHGGIRQASTGGATIGFPDRMSDDQLRQALMRLGYTDLGPIMREGNVITTSASHGSQPTTLKIDARTGAVQRASAGNEAIQMPGPNMDAAELEEQLRALGYTSVRDVEQEGNVYTLDALESGQWVGLKIDARTGAVSVAR